MRIVRTDRHYDFKIKIGNNYVTIATLIPWQFTCRYKYELYFYYYGAEYEGGLCPYNRRNGNESITLHEHQDEFLEDFLIRVQHIVQKKLYAIGTSIMEEIKYTEKINC